MVLQELPLKSLIFFIHPDSPSTNLTLQMKECLHAPKGTGCLPFDHRNNHDSDLSWSGRSNEIISSSGNCDGCQVPARVPPNTSVGHDGPNYITPVK
ncbi:hypothetical protein V6N13_006139 [Hibiscus sabdariffa]